MIYLDNNELTQDIYIPRNDINRGASPEYATKTELENAIENEVIRADGKYATKTDLIPYATTGWVISQDYVNYEEMESAISVAVGNETARTEETYQKISSMSAYSTTNEVEGMIDNAVSGKMDTSAMSAYSTTVEVEQLISAATDDMATETWVNSQGFLTEHQSLSAYSTTEQMNEAIDDAVSGKVDTTAMTAYYTSAQTDTAISNATSGLQETLVSGTNIKTINGESILGSGNIEIQGGGGSYSAGTNIDITDNVISVTGITVPTKLSELENDEGFITSNDIPTSNTAFTNDAGYITSDALSGYAATSALTPIQNQINEVEEVTATALDDLNDRVDEISGNSVTTGTVQSMITAATSGLASTTYVDNSVSGKADSSAVTADIATATAATTGWVESQGYLTGYTETEPIFTGSPAYGITSTDISNWNAVTGLTIPTSNTAFTNDAGYITEDAISGKVDTSRVDEIEEVAASALTDLNIKKLDVSTFESSDLAVSQAINDLESRKVASNDVRDIVKMSQNDYDSLSAKSETTLYIII